MFLYIFSRVGTVFPSGIKYSTTSINHGARNSELNIPTLFRSILILLYHGPFVTKMFRFLIYNFLYSDKQVLSIYLLDFGFL